MINGIEITDVIIFPVRQKLENSALSAFARIVLNDQFIVSGIRIFEGKVGPFVKMPQEYDKKTGKGYDIVFPFSYELKTYINDQILTQYELTIKKEV